MVKIGDFTKKIYSPAGVIDAASIAKGYKEDRKLKDKMLKNILQIYLSEDLINATKNFLSRLITLFNLNDSTYDDDLKPSTFIYGPYSCGKSHFIAFLAILCGLDVEFYDPELKTIDIRVECWKLLEEKIGSEEIDKFRPIREGKFLVSVYTLTSAIAGKDFRTILINTFNTALESYEIRDSIGQTPIESLPQVIKEAYLKVMREKYDDLSYDYNHTSDEKEKNNILERVQQRTGLLKQNLDNDEIVKKMKTILNKNDFIGVILFFDEFFRYYNPLIESDKKITGTYLQNFCHELQVHLKLPLVFVSQVQLMRTDKYLSQVEDRFEEIALKHLDSAPIIQKRILPERDKEGILEFFQLFKNKYPNTVITEEQFIKNYPFHPKTVQELETNIGFYANDERGVITYALYALRKNNDNDGYNLITADTLFDGIIKEIANPKDRSYKLKQWYLQVIKNDQFFEEKFPEESIDAIKLMKKIFKIILFCTDTRHHWSYHDFFNHFYTKDEDEIREILDKFYSTFIMTYQGIHKSLDDNGFYYHEGSTGDVNIYVNKVLDCLEKNACLRKKFQIDLGEKLTVEFKFKNNIKKYVSWYYSGNLGEFEDKLSNDEILNQLVREPVSPNKIKDEDIEYSIIDALIFIDDLHYNDKDEVKRILTDIFDNTDFGENNSQGFQKDILRKCIFYIHPSPIDENIKNAIFKSYSYRIIKRIFEELRRDVENWDEINEILGREFRGLFDETKMSEYFLDFKREDFRMYDSLINQLDTQIRKFNEDPDQSYSLFNYIKTGNILVNLNEWRTLTSIQILDILEIYEYCFENFYSQKYPKINNIQLTKTYMGSAATTWFNRLIRNLFYDDTQISSNPIEPNLKSLFENELSSLRLINLRSRNHFSFRKDFSITEESDDNYFTLFIQLYKDSQALSLKEALKKYQYPPYGFPFRLTAILLLSLIHSEKKILADPNNPNKQIISIPDFNQGDHVKSNHISIYLEYIFAEGDILEENLFNELKNYLSILFSSSDWSEYCIASEELSQNFKKIRDQDALTNKSQASLCEFISKLNLEDKINKMKEFVKKFHEDIVNVSKLAITTPSDTISKEIFKIIIDSNRSEIKNEEKTIENLIKKMSFQETGSHKEFLEELLFVIRHLFSNQDLNKERTIDDTIKLVIYQNLESYWEKLIAINKFYVTEIGNN